MRTPALLGCLTHVRLSKQSDLGSWRAPPGRVGRTRLRPGARPHCQLVSVFAKAVVCGAAQAVLESVDRDPSRTFLSAQPVAGLAQPDCLLARAFKSRDAESYWAAGREDLLEAIFVLDLESVGCEANRLLRQAFENVNGHSHISSICGPVRDGTTWLGSNRA